MTTRGNRWLAPALMVLCAACAQPEPGSESESAEADAAGVPLRVYVVNYPLAWFAERIGGDQVEVTFPAPADEDPAFWSPEAETIARYQQADLVLLNGADYAKWVSRVTLPLGKLVDTSGHFAERIIVVQDATTHSHGPEGAHSHGEKAFTTWLDPLLALEHARAIGKAFSEARPARRQAFEQRFVALERDLLELDRALVELTEGQAARPLLGSHPVYQYLARRYGLDLRSVHFEPDEYPDDAAWSGLERLLAEHPARWMLWEGEPLERTARHLEELGVASVVFDPCGNRPDQGDWLSVMRANVERLRPVLTSQE